MENSEIFGKIDEILDRINKTIDEAGLDQFYDDENKDRAIIVPRNISNGNSITKEFSKHVQNTPPLDKSSRDLSPFQFSFKPKLNKNSVKIAQKLGSPSKRILETPEKKIQKAEGLPFKPVINKRSEKIMSKYRVNSQNRWESLYEESVEKKNRIDYARKLSQENEINDKECTFRPLISDTSRIKHQDLITRTYNWLKLKNDRINVKAEADFEKDLRDCTFSPNIIEFKLENKEHLKNVKGLKLFLDRQHAAKRTYSEKKIEVKKITHKTKDLTPKEYHEAVKGLNQYLHSIDLLYN